MHMGLIVAITRGDHSSDYAGDCPDVFKVAPRTAGGYTHRIVCVRKTGAPFS